MWNVIKILAAAGVVLVCLLPVVWALLRVARWIGVFLHELAMQKAEHAAALVEVRGKQIHRFNRDEQGFVGVVYDDGGQHITDLDEGDEWDVGRRRRVNERQDVTFRQRLLAATDTVRVREPGPPLAQPEEPPFEQPWAQEVPSQGGREEVEI